MAIIGKLMGARPSMSAPRAAPKPAPVSSRPSFDFLTGGQPKQTIPADAFDRDALIQDILSKIQVPSAPVFDPTGLQARLAELESRQAPVFDPSALQEQIAELQNREAPVFDPSELQKQISDLRQRPSRDDFMSIERQLQDLRNRDIPQFDPSALQEQIGGLQQQLGNIPQFDDSALRDRLQALEGREIPQFDASGLQSQIGGLEDRLANLPQFDPSNLQSQIGSLQDRLANLPQFDPTQLQQGIAGLEDRLANIPQFDPSQLQQQIQANRDLLGNIPQFDDTALKNRLQALEGREVPQFDDSALRDRLQALEGREIPQFDPSQLQAGIQGLSDRISNIPQFDPSALQNRLSALENRQAPTFNPDDFREQFLNIAREGIDIPQPTQAFDPSGLQNRLQALENREMPQFDPSRLQERLSALENVQPVAPTPAFDPSSLQARLDALENREPVAAPPAFDPSGLMARLDDFESRLGALQQPLPIQPPGDLDLGIKEDAPDIRDFAKPLPAGGTIFDRVPDIGISPPRPPKPAEQDFGFGPGIRPSEIIGRDGEFVGSGGVTPPQPPQNVVGRPTPPMSIGGPSGGVGNMLAISPGGPIPVSRGGRDDLVFPGGSPTFNERGETFVPPRGEFVTTGPASDLIGRSQDVVPTGPDNIGGGAPSLVDQQMQQGAIDPVLMNQQASEVLTDPLIRSLYFGTADQPGFFQQLQQAGANLIGSDVPLQQTAGLSPLELLARQQAVAGLGGFEPFLQQNRELINQAIEQSRRAESLQDPYYTQAEEIFKDTMGAYDPSMTQQFFNPFEDAVVQQTIDDVLEAGEQQDIAARAQEIGSGAFGGSRARLGAMERREALGEGLAQALGNIRQRGFSEAQQTGLSEFARQQAAKRTGAQGLIGIGVGRGSAAQQLGQQLAGYGGQMGGLGATQEQLRAGQRGELAGFGGI